MIATPEEALTLALQRLRRASSALVEAIQRGDELGGVLSEVEAAVYCAHLDNPQMLRWADEVLLSQPMSARPKTSKQRRRLLALIEQGQRVNIRVATMHDFGEKSFVVYRGQVKIGSAQNDRTLSAILSRALRADRA